MKEFKKNFGGTELTIRFGREAQPATAGDETKTVYYSQEFLDYAVTLFSDEWSSLPNPPVFISSVPDKNGEKKQVVHTGYSENPDYCRSFPDVVTVWTGKSSELTDTRSATPEEVKKIYEDSLDKRYPNRSRGIDPKW